MHEVEMTEMKRRSWIPFRPRRFYLKVPQSWDEVTPLARRQRWWRWLMMLPRPAATRAMVRDLLPKWVRLKISDLNFAGLTLLLDWMQAEPNCTDIPVPRFNHGGYTYFFPTAKGENVTCIEYALADDYYKEFAEGDASKLMPLVATVWHEFDTDEARAMRRADKRVPLYSKAEVEQRAHRLKSAPSEMQLQALLYFGGLKAYIHRVYGKWIFEQDEEPDEEDQEAGSPKKETSSGPDFGWWGIFQQVAESGVFGNIDQVYQASIHDVCIFLVRKRVESNQQPQSSEPKKEDDDDL